MKRLLLIAALLLSAMPMRAAGTDRDVLLVPDGTVYTADVQNAEDRAGGTVIALTIQRGSFNTRAVVPGSDSMALRSAPALAYDAETQTVYVFWLRMPNPMSSELLVSAYRDGKWAPPVSIDNKPYTLRYNLRIAVRHKVAQPQSDGSVKDIPALIIHTVWWEQTGTGEVARYAMVPIDKGILGAAELHDMSEFAFPGDPANVDPAFNKEILKHPAIIDTGSANSVDVVFGDLQTNSLTRVTLRPIAEGRIHIPIGHGGGGRRLGAPTSFTAEWSGNVAAVVPAYDDGTLLLYNVGGSSLNFVLYSNGAWAPPTTIPLNDKLSADAAIAALSRMLSQ